MAKCTQCHGCMRRFVYYDNTRYLACSLCYKVFIATPNKLIEVTNEVIKDAVLKEYGFVKGKIE